MMKGKRLSLQTRRSPLEASGGGTRKRSSILWQPQEATNRRRRRKIALGVTIPIIIVGVGLGIGAAVAISQIEVFPDN
jgi:hypothetical protein